MKNRIKELADILGAIECEINKSGIFLAFEKEEQMEKAKQSAAEKGMNITYAQYDDEDNLFYIHLTF